MAEAVDARQLAAASDGLRAAKAQFPQVIRRADTEAAKIAGRAAKASARNRQQRRMLPGVQVERAQAGGLFVELKNSAAAPAAVPAFKGARRRTGWYAADRYRSSKGRQFPVWGGPGPSPAGEAVEGVTARLVDVYEAAAVGAIVRRLPQGRMSR